METPDQAVVWAYALGLHEEAEEVLERSMEDVRTGAASPTRTYFPLWYRHRRALGRRASAAAASGGGATAGLFSSGVVPDFTAMTAALATIGSPPGSSASSGGGGGGFGGGELAAAVVAAPEAVARRADARHRPASRQSAPK